MSEHPYGWLSILPPIVAILLAIATRKVVLSLIAGIFVGALVTKHGNVLAALHDTWEIHLWDTLADAGKLRVFSFTILMGAMIGVITQCGGMRGLIQSVSPLANTRRRGQLATWFLGMLIFFDDYANTILLGSTLRPICDRLKISRQKLAFLVDSTAAPVAGLALVSTWVAVEIDYVKSGLSNAGIKDVAAFDVFLASIPYRFYVITAMVMVFLVALLGRDFGPMLHAERKALRGDVDALPGLEEEHARVSAWWNAVLPIVVTLVVVVWLIYKTGADAMGAELADAKMRDIVGNGDSSLALQYGALWGLATASILSVAQRLLNSSQVVEAAMGGARVVLPAIAILWCASTVSKLTGDEAYDGRTSNESYAFQDHRLYTGEFLKLQLAETFQPAESTDASNADKVTGISTAVRLLPTVVFILSAFVAFCTGTSWGTMGILMPMVIPLMHSLLAVDDQMGSEFARNPIFLCAVGGVLAGAIFGDHCSPISDTTVLSSQSSGCDHIAHVWTQMPYALAAAVVSIGLGTLPWVGAFQFAVKLVASCGVGLDTFTVGTPSGINLAANFVS
ncbi:MAG: Na+/H+ antiporter NhaC family protein [Pirellulaceae bacterium]